MTDENIQYLVLDTSVAYAASKQALRPAKGDMLLLEYILNCRSCRIIMTEAEDWSADLRASTFKEMLGLYQEWKTEIPAFQREEKPTYADFIFLEWWNIVRSQRKVIEERELALAIMKPARDIIEQTKREILDYMRSKPAQGQREEAELRKMGEDFHLIKGVLIAAALSNPSKRTREQFCTEIIFSRDGEVRLLFAEVAASSSILAQIVWVHMNTDKPLSGCTKGGEQAANWLASGAPFDAMLTLSGK